MKLELLAVTAALVVQPQGQADGLPMELTGLPVYKILLTLENLLLTVALVATTTELLETLEEVPVERARRVTPEPVQVAEEVTVVQVREQMLGRAMRAVAVAVVLFTAQP
jgi:hypothetical protein